MRALRQRGFSLIGIDGLLGDFNHRGWRCHGWGHDNAEEERGGSQQGRSYAASAGVHGSDRQRYPPGWLSGLKYVRSCDNESATDCTHVADVHLACGLVSVTSTTLQFEGDVDGTDVSEVYVELVSLRVGWMSMYAAARDGHKSAVQAGSTPLFYTEVDNVMNTAVFTASSGRWQSGHSSGRPVDGRI